MNILAKVKLSNDYDLVVSSLYKQDGVTPITDVEGTTALLKTDGTSYEFLDSKWQQIDLSLDEKILNSFYSFISSICNSICNDFVKCQFSNFYEAVTISKDLENNSFIISGLSTPPKVITNDYVIVRTSIGSSLTTVKTVTDTSVTVDSIGVEMRISGEPETLGILFVSFPLDFIDTVIAMLGYDLFTRADKEKRQERLGNYTYTNFEPMEYYGTGQYPANLQRKVQFWQMIHT